jgi:hypothetical protein
MLFVVSVVEFSHEGTADVVPHAKDGARDGCEREGGKVKHGK